MSGEWQQRISSKAAGNLSTSRKLAPSFEDPWVIQADGGDIVGNQASIQSQGTGLLLHETRRSSSTSFYKDSPVAISLPMFMLEL